MLNQSIADLYNRFRIHFYKRVFFEGKQPG